MPVSQDQLEEGIPGHRPHSENERVPSSPGPSGRPPLSRVTSAAFSKCTVSAFYLSKNNTVAVSGHRVAQNSYLRKLFCFCAALFSDQGEEQF